MERKGTEVEGNTELQLRADFDRVEFDRKSESNSSAEPRVRGSAKHRVRGVFRLDRIRFSKYPKFCFLGTN